MLGEEPRPLRKRIATDQLEHPSGWNPLRPAGEFHRPCGVGLGKLHGVEIGLRAADLFERLPLPFDRCRLRAVTPEGGDEFGGVATGLVVEFFCLGERRTIHPEGGVVLVECQRREQADPGEDRQREGHVEAVTEPPAAHDRHQGQRGHDQAGHDDRPEELARRTPALEHLQELKQEQEVPLGARGGVGERGIGRSTEFGTQVPRMHHLAGEHRPQASA